MFLRLKNQKRTLVLADGCLLSLPYRQLDEMNTETIRVDGSLANGSSCPVPTSFVGDS